MSELQKSKPALKVSVDILGLSDFFRLKKHNGTIWIKNRSTTFFLRILPLKGPQRQVRNLDTELIKAFIQFSACLSLITGNFFILENARLFLHNIKLFFLCLSREL